jgi:hypothetical protein
MEIKDLTGLSKPLTRLIDVIAQGIGGVFSPYLIRMKADAKAHEIRVISQALGEVAAKHNLPVIYKDGELDLWQKPEDKTLILDATAIENRSNHRLEYQERKRQANIEKITSVAAAELAEDEEVAPESPDEDWVARFFSAAQDVSSDQMQDLWGRILAGEIRHPGTYSLRTLDFIRNLTKDEAELVAHVGKLALFWMGTSFIPSADKNLLGKRGLVAGHHFSLGELDVLYPSDLRLKTFRDESVEEEAFIFGDRLLLIKRGEIASEIPVTIWKFTNIGRELLPLVPAQIDDEYLEQFGQTFVARKGKAYIAEITERLPNGQIRYNTMREIVADTDAGSAT